jgi:hypothetical protein
MCGWWTPIAVSRHDSRSIREGSAIPYGLPTAVAWFFGSPISADHTIIARVEKPFPPLFEAVNLIANALSPRVFLSAPARDGSQIAVTRE